MSQSALTIVPILRDDAFAYVRRFHRHHDQPQGFKFAVGVEDSDGRLRGVAIAGRAVGRWKPATAKTLIEITRVCTDGCENACSALYGACRRAAWALGYQRVVTYTAASEPGTSLRAAGFVVEAKVRGRMWNCPSRPRDENPVVDKIRWGVRRAA